MLVVIHGWSSDAEKMIDLADAVEKILEEKPVSIYLGDYVSLDDDVTFNDLTEALDRAWTREGISREPRSVDVIIHSTGGLVIRDWLARYYGDSPDAAPIKHLLMLAPANFGSPIARMGQSGIGRIFAGWGSEKGFESGKLLLKGLELASPYSWKLAERDLFSGKPLLYGTGRILCTVLIGCEGYSGIQAMANRPGSDGVVMWATANLNASRITMDLSTPACAESCVADIRFLSDKFRLQDHTSLAAFGVLPNLNHSTLTLSKKQAWIKNALPLIREALMVDDADFGNWCEKLDGITRKTLEKAATYQNCVVRVVDNYNNPVTDYVVEIYAASADEKIQNASLTTRVQEKAIDSVHAFSSDASYRSFYINCKKLNEILNHSAFDPSGENPMFLKISVTAHPQLRDGDSRGVGYKTGSSRDVGSFSFSREEARQFFSGNRTVLITIRIKRWQGDQLFTLESKEAVKKKKK